MRNVETYNDNYVITTNNTFNNITTGNWILGLLTETSVTKQRTGNPSITKNSTIKYNSAGFLIQNILLPTDGNLKLQTDYELDDFGNTIQKTISGPQIQSRTIQSIFNNDGNLQIESINELGFLSKTSYKNQLPDSLISINGLVTKIFRDPFGRELEIHNPDNSIKTNTYYDCNSVPGNCPVNAVFYVKEQLTGKPVKYSYFDKLDRLIRSVTESFGSNSFIISDKSFNPDGTVSKQSEPYFTGTIPIWNSFDYDQLKRVVKRTEPGNRVTIFNYSGFSTIIIDPEGHRNTQIINSQEKLIKSVDNNNIALNLFYDSDNNLVETDLPNGTSIFNKYDLRGNKVSTNDPDMGFYYILYNTLGQPIKEVNPKGNIIQYQYDILGRKIKITEAEGTTEWKFDPINSLGNPDKIFVNGKLERQYLYDNLSRVSQVDYYIGTQKKSYQYQYSSFSGIISNVIYPGNANINFERTSNGFLNRINGTNIKNRGSAVLWSAVNYNQYNTETKNKLGNNIYVNKNFDPNTNFLTQIKGGSSSGSADIQDLNYQYSLLGNLSSRRDNLFGLNESFTYDELNRLVKSTVNNTNDVSLEYDISGNIVYKSDIGHYKYGEDGKSPNSLTSIDNKGIANCIYGFNQNITYTSFNYVSAIKNNNTEITYAYGPDREREMTTVRKNGFFTQIKKYFGDLYEETTDRYGNISYAYYIKNGNEVIAIIAGSSDINIKDSINYILKDNVGSVYAVTDEVGKVKERYSYDAWGKTRSPLNWLSYPVMPQLSQFGKGFTFHEMIDMDFLVFMNARIYNPVLGRFFSPDPFIQSPENLQSYNRFSYVFNNPLSYTDPSGYFKLGRFIKNLAPKIIGWTILLVATPIVGPVAAGALAGFGSAFTGGIINGQSLGASFKLGLQGAEWGAYNASVAYLLLRIPGDFHGNPIGGEIKAVLYGSARGLESHLQGSSFSNGFISGFIDKNLQYARDEFVRSRAEREGVLSEEQMERANATLRLAHGYTREGFENYWDSNGDFVFKVDGSDNPITIQDPDFQNLGTFPSENHMFINENSGFMSFLAKNIPGLNSMAVAHDYFATTIPSLGSTFLNYTISISTIPVFIYIQYRAIKPLY